MTISLDKKQLSFLNQFKILAQKLEKKGFLDQIFQKFSNSNKAKGVYLYGSVGRGKTMLMKIFYDMINIPKEIVHFQNFMHNLHKKIHKIQNQKNTDQIIQNIAKDLSLKVKILFIDEFEVKDITDAMIVMRLFDALTKFDIFIFVTTNNKPSDLYKDGLQRSSFIPFIKDIEDNFMVLNLDGIKDYRFENANSFSQKIFFPLNNTNKQKIAKIKSKLCNEDEMHPGEIAIFGRKITFPHTHQNILFTNFKELFEQNFSYADYVNLCQKFEIIIVEDIRIISENETDIIIRFINFIDNVYFYKILLFATLEEPPHLIYRAGKRLSEYQRTISRLQELS